MTVAQPGWYPDPAGTPATYRYWDGSQWSEATTTDPSSPPPGAAPPPPPTPEPPALPPQPAPTAELPSVPGGMPPADVTQVAPQQQWGQQGGYGGVPSPPPAPGAAGGGGFTGGMPPMPPTSPGGSGGGTGKIVLIAVAAVVALILLGVGGFFGVRALTGDDTKDSAGDDSSETTEEGETDEEAEEPGNEPPDDSDTATPPASGADCLTGAPTVADDQQGNDRIQGLGISMPRVDGYEVDIRQSSAFTWAFDFTPQAQSVEERWISLYGVGGVATSFGTPEETAEAVMQCMTESETMYSGFSGREDLDSGEVDVPGAESAWSATAEIRVDDPEVEAEGDVAQVIVVDTGDDELYGLYLSVVPIGDDERIKQQALTATELKAE